VKSKAIIPVALAGIFLLAGCAASADTTEAAETEPAKCVAEVPDSALVEAGKLNLGTNATLPPLSYTDEAGALLGQRIEMGEEIAERLCLDVVWTNAQATTLQPSMDAGRIDAVNIGFFVTDERIKVMRMIPTEQMGISISVGEGNPKKIEAVEDLSGLAVGAAVASFEEKTLIALSDELVAQGLEPMKIQTFNEYNIVFQTLSSGQIDAAATTSPVSAYYEEKGGFTAAITDLSLTNTAIAVGGDNAVLGDAIVTALDSMKDDGTYEALLEKYNLTAVDTFEVLFAG